MRMAALTFLAVSLVAPAAAADNKDEQKPKKAHVICKRDEDTGSRMSKVVCKTAEEWARRNLDEDSPRIGIAARGQPGGSGVVPTGN
jgi:hypothetical protein